MFLGSVRSGDCRGCFVGQGKRGRMGNMPGVVREIISDYPKRPRTSNSERAD